MHLMFVERKWGHAGARCQPYTPKRIQLGFASNHCWTQNPITLPPFRQRAISGMPSGFLPLSEMMWTGHGTYAGLNVDYRPAAGSPLLNAASFSGLPAWFDTVSYMGAFASDGDWLSGWTHFDPNHTDY